MRFRTVGERRQAFAWINVGKLVKWIEEVIYMSRGTLTGATLEFINYVRREILRGVTLRPWPYHYDDEICTDPTWHPAGPHYQWTRKDEELAASIEASYYRSMITLRVERGIVFEDEKELARKGDADLRASDCNVAGLIERSEVRGAY